MLTQDRLRELLHYDPETGIFTRRVTTAAKVGATAGYLDKLGYVIICADGKRYTAARLAWLYMTGEWPIEAIKYINDNNGDLRWSNLRKETRMSNIDDHSRNSTGFRGVCRQHKGGGFVGQIGVQIGSLRKTIRLGTFATAQEAHAAYAKACANIDAENAAPT
jgi:HNH endonuclease